MKTTNKNISRFIVIVLFIGLAIAIGISTLLYFDNKQLENQVIEREKLIEKSVLEESLLCNQKTMNDSIIERYIEDCNILINNKKVSTEELLEFINNQIKTINKLQTENAKIIDSLSIYKAYIKLSKTNLNVDYKTEEKNDKLISTIILPTDSLKIYKKLYEFMQRDYGILYELKSDEENIYYTKKYTKLDSALFVYKYYKHVLSGDSLGNVTITLPERKGIKKRR